MRPLQWIKNLLVFVAPAATGVLVHRLTFLQALAVFGIFCAAASGTYLVNDTVDREADRRHPEKRRRPIASGAVSVPSAVTIGVSLMAGALVSAWFLDHWRLLVAVAAYVVISVGYTIFLKRVPVVELLAVASSFLLRSVAGGLATHSMLSGWLLAVSVLGAFFVVTGKRTAEHVALGDNRGAHRAVLAIYSQAFLRSVLALAAVLTVTAYCVWVFSDSTLAPRTGHHIIWARLSVVPVVFGLLYLVRVFETGRGGAPETLVLHDRFLQMLGLLWLALFAIGLYL